MNEKQIELIDMSIVSAIDMEVSNGNHRGTFSSLLDEMLDGVDEWADSSASELTDPEDDDFNSIFTEDDYDDVCELFAERFYTIGEAYYNECYAK